MNNNGRLISLPGREREKINKFSLRKKTFFSNTVCPVGFFCSRKNSQCALLILSVIHGDSQYGNRDCSLGHPLSHAPGAITSPKIWAAKNVSIRGSPYIKTGIDTSPSIMEMGNPRFSIQGLKTNKSPFPYGDPHIKTGLGTSWNEKEESLFRDWKNLAKKFERVLRL